ncbi:hypothetical protein F4561_001316 [Lipingzhangella halophila]|uniref:Galactose oxidase n=1 Tax=Lipingzhangella halophila TaxID=1783352 RepID=A0A7W7W1C4_9ACTN|nr:hypothetical protein [Lipingzhangella halophila]MBB4930496.1 hypothetical protein [Lipingzhangella halophila]
MNPPSRSTIALLALSLLAVSCGPEKESWDVSVSVSELPSAPLDSRQDHSLLWSGTELLVWGGHGANQHDSFSDGAAYSPETGSWRTMTEVDLESRTRHSAVLVEDRMLVWGGFTPSHSGGTEAHLARDGALYDIRSDSWEPIAPAPEGRSMARAAVVGEHVVFGGGYSEQDGEEFLVYSVAEDTWDTVAPGGGGTGFDVYDMRVLDGAVVAVGGTSQGIAVAAFGMGDTSAPVREISGLEGETEELDAYAGLAVSPAGEILLAVRGGENARLYEVDDGGHAELVDELGHAGFRPPVSLLTHPLDAGRMDFAEGLGLLATAPGEFSMWDAEAGTSYRSSTRDLSDYCGPLEPVSDGALLGWGGMGCESSGVRVDITA